MVNENRVIEKIHRIEAKMLGYDYVLAERRKPLVAHVLTSIRPDRLGKELTPDEEARYRQAIGDLKADLEKNLEILRLSWKDYLKDAEQRGVADGIQRAIALIPQKRKRKATKKVEEEAEE